MYISARLRSMTIYMRTRGLDLKAKLSITGITPCRQKGVRCHCGKGADFTARVDGVEATLCADCITKVNAERNYDLVLCRAARENLKRREERLSVYIADD